MPALILENLEKHYAGQVAVSSVSLTVRDGEFVSLLGPSGCGKTTILRMVAGLITPSGGRILIDDRDVTGLPPNRRRIGLVFQSYALFPHMTVFENVAFGLRRQGIKGAQLQRQVDEALAGVRLSPYADRMPRQLSGGQQQRVAVARSIAPRPSIMLFDEPLSNLDAALRDEMQIELKRLQREVGITTLFVTHDQAEAMAMSDRVCVLAQGKVQQFASPEEIYHRPASGFVAGFIGRPNRLKGHLQHAGAGRSAVLLAGGVEMATADTIGAAVGDAVDVVIRQEDVRLMPFDPSSHGRRDLQGRPADDEAGSASAGVVHVGRVALRAFVGARVQYVVSVADGLELIVETPTNGPHAGFEVGTAVGLSVDPAHVYLSRAGA